jgi:GR25 family glycosyltransferase involved in LPS biosynthesis
VKFQTYVISLTNRVDRRIEFEKNHSRLRLDFQYVEAVDGALLETNAHFSPPNVAACWLSHQKVANLLLSTGDEFALVLEDDAVLDFRVMDLVNRESELSALELDLFQVGYNIQNDRVASGHKDSHLRIRLILLCLVHRFLEKVPLIKSSFCRTHNIHTSLNLPHPCILGLFETGTHAYIMSRKLAKIIVDFNNPVLLPADIALCELAKLDYINMARPSKTYSKQTDSTTSIFEISNEVMETKIAKVTERVIDDYCY